MACLGAIEQLGWPLDRIVTAEIWATDEISADLPPMVEFKEKADRIIKQRYGIDVTHVCAERFFQTVMEGGCLKPHTKKFSTWKFKTKKGDGLETELRKNATMQQECRIYTDSPALLERGATQNLRLPLLTRQKVSYQDLFYKKYNRGKKMGKIRGFAQVKGNWCTSELKSNVMRKFFKNCEGEVLQYIGIASDETVRVERHKDKPNILMPLVWVGWTEADCKQWCIDNDLLSPIYSTSMRGGCWFCHNQSVDQLRLLRRDYPDLWALLLKWDMDSPITFKADGRTVHDYDKRFCLEDLGLLRAGDKRFKWKMLDEELNYSLF